MRVRDLIKYEALTTIYKIRSGNLRIDFEIPSNEEIGMRSASQGLMFYVQEQTITATHYFIVVSTGTMTYQGL